MGGDAIGDLVPSAHSASAAAFAISVEAVMPGLRLPLRAAAAVVGFLGSIPASITPATSS